MQVITKSEMIKWEDTKALLIVAGVRKDGYREILGLKLAENEREDFWMNYLKN